MSNKKKNHIPEELRKYWLLEENNELGLSFDKLSGGSNKRAWWNINGIKKFVIIKSVVKNQKTKPEPIPEEYRKHWVKDKNDLLGLIFDGLSRYSHKEAWWIFKGEELFVSVDIAIRSNQLNKINSIPEVYREFWASDLNGQNGFGFDEYTINSTQQVYWYYKGNVIELSISDALKGKVKSRLEEKLKKHPRGNYLPESVSIDWYSEINEQLGYEFDDITFSSNKMVHWKCDKHISYNQRVVSYSKGANCPYCSYYYLHPFDSVWSNEKFRMQFSPNNDKEVYEVSLHTSNTVLWLNDLNKDFEQGVQSRVDGYKPRGYSHKDYPREKSIGVLKSSWLDEWDYEKNDKLSINPYKTAVLSHKKVYWKCLNCEEHDSYLKTPEVKSRIVADKNPCPLCIRKIISIGVLKPEWLKEWDYNENEKLKLDPFLLASKSNIKVYWKCLENTNHKSYLRSPAAKGIIKEGRNPCPSCNSLGALRPEWLEEWDYAKNDKWGIKPFNIGAGSRIEVYWKCMRNKKHKSQLQSPAAKGRMKKDRKPCPDCIKEDKKK